MTAPAAHEPSGVPDEPETSPVHTTHATDLEGEGCPLAKDGDTLAQIVGAEAVLSQQHPQVPTQQIHVQTVSAVPEAIPGEPGATKWQLGDPSANPPKGVAHVEPDSMPGEDFDPNTNAPVHLEGTGPETLLEEEGTAGEKASIEEDRDPRIELQEPGISHLAVQEKAGSLTLPSPQPPTIPKAASTQRSPAANPGTPDIPVPDRGADLELPPPNEAAEPPIHQLPEQIQAPTEVGGPLESLPGEESQHTMGQRGLTSARTHEGKMPIREVHSRPPDIPDPQRQGSITWEPASIIPKAHVHIDKAQRPILDEGAHTRPDPWPSLGIVITNLDTYLGSASQLEGEQNIHIPCVGSELHAAPSAPQNSSSSLSPLPPVPPPSDTLVRKNPSCGEGAAAERCATEDRRPEPSKPSSPHEEDLQEAGGVPSVPGDSPAFPEDLDLLGPACVAENADVGKVDPPCVDAHKRGGVLPAVCTTPALAEGTVGVGPADEAETACAAKPEALVPWAQDKAGRGRKVNEPPHEALPQKGEHNADAPPRKRERHPNKGEREPVQLQGEVPRGDEGALEMPARTHEHKPNWPPREVLREDTLPTWEASNAGRETETPSRKGKLEVGALPQGCTNEGDHKPSWPLQEPSHEDVPSTWEGVLWDPGGRLPKGQILNSNCRGQGHCTGHRRPQEKPWLHKAESVRQHHHEGSTTHLGPCTFHPIPPSRSPLAFRFKAHREGMASSWAMQSRDTATRTRQRGRLVAVTLASHAVTCVPAPCTLVHWQRSSTCGHNRSIQSLRAPVFIWRHFAAVPRLSAK